MLTHSTVRQKSKGHVNIFNLSLQPSISIILSLLCDTQVWRTLRRANKNRSCRKNFTNEVGNKSDEPGTCNDNEGK